MIFSILRVGVLVGGDDDDWLFSSQLDICTRFLLFYFRSFHHARFGV